MKTIPTKIVIMVFLFAIATGTVAQTGSLKPDQVKLMRQLDGTSYPGFRHGTLGMLVHKGKFHDRGALR